MGKRGGPLFLKKSGPSQIKNSFTAVEDPLNRQEKRAEVA